MKKSIVPPRVIEQKAKQLKREKSLKYHQALDEAAQLYGFFNYQNYKNTLEANRKQSKPPIEVLLKDISSENDMSKKMKLAISSIQNFKIPFDEQLDILKLLPHPHNYYDLNYSEEFDILQAVCKKLNLMKDEAQMHLFNDFLTDEGKADIQGLEPYFIAKEISLSNLAYGIEGDMLLIDGNYHLKVKFEFEIDQNDPISQDERFNDRELFGSFGVKIDKNKKITIEESDIGTYN
jgi:hypothetical protein